MIDKLKFYCQKILPLVYDDSLSYYEVLCKVTNKLNEVIEHENELRKEWEEFIKAFKTDLYETVKNIMLEWKNDGTLNEIITNISQSIVNAVICGIDNSGNTDVGEDITNLLNRFTGRKIYFPSGRYKINTTIKMRTDGNYHGNILWCDNDSTFFTDGVSLMFQFGNGNEQTKLCDFGIDGGYIDAKNVTETVILINNKQFTCKLSNFIIANVGDARGIQIGTDTTTSSQVKMHNLTINGDGSVRGDGIYILGTDNFINNVNIGRMRRNLVIGGGGNKIHGLHTWNFGSEYEVLGIVSPEEKRNYPSIRINGSNVFSDVQIDNGSPALQFTKNATTNIIGELTLNYEENYPWATSDDKCSGIIVLNNNNVLGTNIKINAINFAPRNNLKIRMIDFQSYNENNLYWLQKQTWDIGGITDRNTLMRRLEGDFGRSIVNEKPVNILSNYITNNDISKCILLGYIGVNGKNLNSKYRFSDLLNKGYIDANVINTNNVISIEAQLTGQFGNAGSLIFGTDIVILCDKKFIPVYVKFNSTGAIYNGIKCQGISLSDMCNSFVYNRLPVYADIPTNKVEINLR